MSCLTALCRKPSPDLSTNELRKELDNYDTWQKVVFYSALFFLALGTAACGSAQMYMIEVGTVSLALGLILMSLSEFHLVSKIEDLNKILLDRYTEEYRLEKEKDRQASEAKSAEIKAKIADAKQPLYASDPDMTLELFKALSDEEMIRRFGKEIYLNLLNSHTSPHRERITQLGASLTQRVFEALLTHWDLLNHPGLCKTDYIVEFLENNSAKSNSKNFLKHVAAICYKGGVNFSELFETTLVALPDEMVPILNIGLPVAYVDFVITQLSKESRNSFFKHLLTTEKAELVLTQFAAQLSEEQKNALKDFLTGDDHGLSENEVSECLKLLK